MRSHPIGPSILTLTLVLACAAYQRPVQAETPDFGLKLESPVRQPRSSVRVTTFTGLPDLFGVAGNYRFESGLTLEGGVSIFFPSLFFGVGYGWTSMLAPRTSFVVTPLVFGYLGLPTGAGAGVTADFVFWMGDRGQVGFNLQLFAGASIVASDSLGVGSAFGGGNAVGIEPFPVFHLSYGVAF